MGNLVCDRVGIDRHRYRAEHLGGRDRPVEARPVGTHDRDRIAAHDTELRQPARKGTDLLVRLRPGPHLPDAEVLVPDRRPAAAHTGVMGQKFWKGVRPCGGADRHGAFPLFPPVDAKMSASPMPLLAILGNRAALTNKSAAWHYSGFPSIWPDHVMPGHTGGLANVNHSAMTGTHAVSTTFNNERSRFDNHS